MKNIFNTVVIVACLATAFIFYLFIMGAPSGFNDPMVKHEPKPGNVMATIYTGGPLVGLLLSFILMSVVYTVERSLTIRKARGTRSPEDFTHSITKTLANGDLDAALAQCDEQRGSLANVLRSAILRFKAVESDSQFADSQKLSEVQRAIDEELNLETPLLEKNLVMLSTIASISTMVGLLGTTIGMIKAFQALAMSGTVSATQLSLGISEALYNTAGGLIGAIICITMYNYFTTVVDGFVYNIDEAILSVTEIFTTRIKK
ncbi:MAG: MotA/TolQ/ExbB proton channel family protein [Candidatus Kapabacteria bacterium]|jgi:biopolymer transport protein ExbB|nr:MotA/TolQ/ExbB proton channel family protein [Candidatus Kapabacteria bacterium]